MHGDVIKIGAILRTARETKGMTQTELARAIDVSSRTIMDIENDKRLPTFDVLTNVIHTLGLPSDHIFWPEQTTYEPGHEQLNKAVAAFDERDKKLFMDIAWAFVQSVNSGEKVK
jgi:DNA-binding XRE family transcriptional regulator